jgi:hypothetical protein
VTPRGTFAALRALLVATLLLASAAIARADSASELATARQLRQDLDFDGALAALDRAIAAGDNTPATLAECYSLAGQLHAGLGDDTAATADFARLLALDPRATLPPGTSPKILAPFEQARLEIASRGSLEIRTTATTIVVDRDPYAMVAGVVILTSDARTLRVRGPGPYSTPRKLGWTAHVVDAHGNTLFTTSYEQRTTPTAARPPLHARWELWAILGAASAITGTYTGLRFRDAQSEWNRLRVEDGQHDFTDLEDVRRRGERDALIANIAFGVAATTAVVSAVLLLREQDREHALRPVVDVTPTGGAVGLAGRF